MFGRFILKRFRSYIFILFFLTALLLPSKTFGDDKQTNIIADEIVYKKVENLIIGKGSVDVRYEEIKLLGDRIEINTKTGDGIAIGNVLVEGKGSRISGKKFLFNIYTERGIMFDASGFAAPFFYFSGDMVERIAEDRLRIQQGKITSCKRDCPEDRVPWEFKSKTSNVQIEQFAKLQHPSFHILGFPILYFPYAIVPIKTKRSTGFLFPEIGSSNQDGFFLNNLFFWAINDYMDATIGLDYLRRRGTRYNFQFRYMLSEDTFGQFDGAYLKDGEFFNQSIEQNSILFDGTDGSGQKTSTGKEYYIAKLDHEQIFKHDVKGLLQIDIENQGENFSREFMNDLELRSRRDARSFLSLTKNWETRSLEFITERIEGLQEGPDDIFGRLPSLTFTISDEKIKNTPLFLKMDSSVVNFFQDKDNNKTEVFRGDFFPQISLPLTKLPWFTITPKVGFRETAYSEQRETSKEATREFFVAGTTFQGPTYYNIFNANIGDIVKVKHLIEPTVSYDYISDSDDEINDDINVFDSVDSFGPQNSATYSLTNRILAKEELGEGEFETRQILKFVISNSYSINVARDTDVPWKRAFSGITLSLDTNIFRNLEFNVDTNYNIEGDKFSTVNSVFRYSLKDLGYVDLETRFSQDALTGITDTRYYIGGVGTDYFKKWEFEYNIRYDDLDNKTDENYFRAKYKSQCWALEFNLLDRPDETQFFFLVSLVGIGEIGKGFSLSTLQRGLGSFERLGR
ncbi:MAG TPA: LPS assembly protein LptD [Nitrospinota bacterium]|nr:LPS assembly protein LptD [Nitrospinota bacterium]